MSPSDLPTQDVAQRADRLGMQTVEQILQEASSSLKLDPQTSARLAQAGKGEARLRHPAVAVQRNAGDDELESLDFAVVRGASPGKFDPRVIQLKLSPLIASACGAVGSALGSVPLLGWAMIAVTASIALRDFWKKKVTFEGIHGQLLFEMYRSTDSGKSHAIPVDHLFANVNASRADSHEPPLARGEFELALNLLVSNGILGLGSKPDTIEWTEMAISIEP